MNARVIVVAPFLLFACSCDKGDKEAVKIGQPPSPSASVAPEIKRTPEAPRPLRIAIAENTAVLVDGERFGTSDSDFASKLAQSIANRPRVAGETIAIEAVRAAKVSQMSAVLTSLRKAKAKGAMVRTENRDKTLEPVSLVFFETRPAECTSVGYIGKDASINVWTIAGAVAKKFNKGLAGPDMTLGSEALRNLAGKCDAAPAVVIGGDEAMTWGLVFDLALYARGGGDAGMLKTKDFVLASDAVPGRKVVFDP